MRKLIDPTRAYCKRIKSVADKCESPMEKAMVYAAGAQGYIITPGWAQKIVDDAVIKAINCVKTRKE